MEGGRTRSGAMPSLTRVTFRVKADLEIGQNLRITGDTRQLGSFSPNRGLDLVTTPKEYPYWRTNRPVHLPAGLPLSYKYVIVSGGQFHGWEPISAHARVVIPQGSEMTVEDEAGVYEQSQVEPPRRARPVHTHVRFQIDEEERPSSADASAGTAAPARDICADDLRLQHEQQRLHEQQQLQRNHQPPLAVVEEADNVAARSAVDGAVSGAAAGAAAAAAAAGDAAAAAAAAASSAIAGADADDCSLEVEAASASELARRQQEQQRMHLERRAAQLRIEQQQHKLKQQRKPPLPRRERTSSSDSRRTSSSSTKSNTKPYRMFLVSFDLPVLLHVKPEAPVGKRWTAEWNPNSISRKSEGSVAYDHNVKWVGAITPDVLRNAFPGRSVDLEFTWTLTDEDREEIRERLRAFDCVPIFMSRDVFVDHVVRCGLLRIRDTFHNVLDVHVSNEDRCRAQRARRDSEDVEGAGAGVGGSTHVERDRWDGFVEGCTLFAHTIMDLLTQEGGATERDLVWVHNYELMLLPQLLRVRARELKLAVQVQPKIVFFLHTPFPTSEIFRTLSVRDELLEGVLGANVVGFHTFDHARHFITSCKRFLGLQFHSQQGGRLVVDHMDRAVLIAISHVGIERHQLDSAVLSIKGQSDAQAIRDRHRGKKIIVGMDTLTRLKGVPLKLLAFEKLLADVPHYRNKVVFIQHGLITLEHHLVRMSDGSPDGYAKVDKLSVVRADITRAITEVKQLCDRINRVHGPVVVFKEYEPHEWPSVEERAAIWAAADLMVCTPVMEGLNLLPLEYAFCHRDPAGVVVVSEFSAASRVLNGAIRINCYDIHEIAQALDQALCLPEEERNARRERDCSYITNRSSAAWTRNILNDIEAGIQGELQAITSLDKDILQGSEYHSVVSFENVVLEGFCRPLRAPELIRSFASCSRRLVLLDYAGTLAPRELGNLAVKRDFMGVSKRKLSPKVNTILKLLCSDPRNVVFVISGNSAPVLSAAFNELLADPSTPLGVVAHSGVMIRWGNLLESRAVGGTAASLAGRRTLMRMRGGRAAPVPAQPAEAWEYMLPGVQQEWSRWIEAADVPRILEDYTWRTGGSSWRQSAVSTSWQFRQADPEWGGMQAVKLQQELEEAIRNVNVPIAVTRKKHTVELLPKGVDKGQAISYILDELKRRAGWVPQFCFCVGDDTSDEPMYSAVLDFVEPGGGSGGADATPEQQQAAVSPAPASTQASTPASTPTSTPPPQEQQQQEQQQQEQQECFEHVFTCTVGRKPTAAQYFVNDTEQVVEVIQALSTLA